MTSPGHSTAGRLAWLGGTLLIAVALFASACSRSTNTPAAASVTTPAVEGTASQGSGQPASATPTGMPPLSTAPGNAAWSVEIVQAGAVLPEANSTVQMARAPFALRLRMAVPAPVKLNVSTTDQNFQALQPGYVFTEDCLLALCTGMDVAEERLNPGQVLFVDAELTHYLYYSAPDDHRWSRVELTEREAVLERDVAILNETPIEQTADAALYLLVYLEQDNPQQIDPGELTKVMLLFE
jgi:hypothetical protein